MPIKHRDGRIGRTRGDIDAILGIDDDAAAQAELHSCRELAPVFDQFVRVGPAADARRGLGFRGPAQLGHSQADSRGTGPFDEVTPGKAMREKIFVNIHNVVAWELAPYGLSAAS